MVVLPSRILRGDHGFEATGIGTGTRIGIVSDKGGCAGTHVGNGASTALHTSGVDPGASAYRYRAASPYRYRAGSRA